MNPRSFLILHGVENWRPREHWQWWLAHELRARGEHVFYPQLPAPSSPALDEWLAVLHGELSQLGNGERVIIAHSCGVALWLLAAAELHPGSTSTASRSSLHRDRQRSLLPIALSSRSRSTGTPSHKHQRNFRSSSPATTTPTALKG
jgi:predicted alpha/beta hydrolase family esterase